MQKINSNSNNEDSVYFSSVSNIRELAKIPFPTKYFSLLLCADFGEISTDDISHAVEILLKKGNLYFCAWGPDCKRAHDIYDEVIAITEIQYLVMTTWHEKESLDDTLWFVLNLATLYEKNADDCSKIILSVNNNEWEEEVLKNLSDIAAFNERMVNE